MKKLFVLLLFAITLISCTPEPTTEMPYEIRVMVVEGVADGAYILTDNALFNETYYRAEYYVDLDPGDEVYVRYYENDTVEIISRKE